MRTQVLQNWQPSKLDADVINREFGELLAKKFEVKQIRIVPAFGTPHPQATLWHFDPVSLYSVIWSNVWPTEVLFVDANFMPQGMLEAHPGDIILLNNTDQLHRMPEGCPPERWVAWAEVFMKEG